MASTELAAETNARLEAVSTATLSTLPFKRGPRNRFIREVHPLRERGDNMAGPACTLRYIPAREDLDELSVVRDPEDPRRKAIDAAPAGATELTDCEDFVTEQIQPGAGIIGLYPPTDPANLGAFARWRAEQGR